MIESVCLKTSGVDVVGAQQQQRARPVDRLGDRRRLLEVQLAHEAHQLDQPAGDRLRQLGGVQAHDRQLVLGRRVVEPQVQAAALERLGQLARVVGGQHHHGVCARLDPARARGSRSGSPRAARAASPRTPGRSCRSRRSAARPARAPRSRSSAGGRAGTPRRRCRPGRRPSPCRRPRPGSAAAACGSSTRRAPWPRRGPRSTAGARACGRGSSPAPWPAPSCRRRPGPRPARACRAGPPGRRPARSTRRAGSRPTRGPRRPRIPRPARVAEAAGPIAVECREGHTRPAA